MKLLIRQLAIDVLPAPEGADITTNLDTIVHLGFAL